MAWIGKSIIIIAIIHSVFGFVVFSPAISAIFSSGLLNTVNGQSDREWAFWFIACGFTWFLLGWLIDLIEKSSLHIPLAFRIVTFLLVGISVAIMPASGFWLGLIPAVGLMLHYHQARG